MVDRTRSSLGLAGNLRQGAEKPKVVATGEKLGSPRNETAATANVQPKGNRLTVLDDLEAEIDRLMFKVMGIGDLAEIEDSLRRTRRLLYVTRQLRLISQNAEDFHTPPGVSPRAIVINRGWLKSSLAAWHGPAEQTKQNRRKSAAVHDRQKLVPFLDCGALPPLLFLDPPLAHAASTAA